MRTLLIALSLLFGVAHAADITFSGWTNPKTYLSEFPLGQVTGQDVLSQLGVPARTVSFGGAEYWTYPLVPVAESPRQFTFEIRDGKVTDVQYNNKYIPDAHDGLSAKILRNKEEKR